tara:strand:+ start:163 stop:546 length:384 start_codon:yes stop_codon:yes gene_type:complete
MIEQEYINKIEEIKQNNDKLTDWETKFVFGDDDSTPIDTRPQLSISQKSIVDRIYQQRVQGVKSEPVTEIKFDSNRVVANKAETGSFTVTIDGDVVGPNVSQREAIAIVGWLSEVIDTIKPLENAPF